MSKVYFGDGNDKAQHPKKIYVGDEDGTARLVKKIYAGGEDGLAHQVWPYTLLPKAYQRVEYIYNTNTTEFINIGVYPSSNTRSVIQFAISNSAPFSSAYKDIYGVASTYVFRNYRQSTNRRINIGFNGTSIGQTNISDDTTYVIDFNKDGGNFYLDGTQSASATATFAAAATPAILFGYSDSSNQNGKATSTPYRLYHLQVFENNTIIRDMYPCYRISDTAVGVFDLVNKTFYGNDGTGIFYKGPDVEG